MEPPQKIEEMQVDKDRFDSILRKMAMSEPLPRKDLAGTFTRKRKDKKPS